ncbi:uncharacterized protein LOC112565952 [Pomacea canaliculata]|uniref:uncharacterized protein LOC112565952 n=1 Tax=Pomacea canaliculata TaxID=400727 RepID=UPI000D72A034|nr:uncharacterized protein LOC112565952 [Pomacea canaliculata]
MNFSQSNEEFLPWNHPDNVLSYKAVVAVAAVHHTVMKPVVVSVAVSTNIVNCQVFRRQGLRDRMNLCLCVLSLVDMFYLTFSMVFTASYWAVLINPVVGEVIYQNARCYLMGVNYGLRETSTCINTVIAMERCLCVLLPLQAKTLVSTRTMGILLVAIAISMQFSFITTPIKSFIFPVYDGASNETWWKLTLADSWQKSAVLRVYDKIDDTIMLVVFPILTFILVSGATAITVVSLRAAILWRQKTSSTSGEAQVQQVALTKMLVVVSCFFIAGKVPMISVTVARIVYPEFSPSGRQCNLHRVCEMLARYIPYIYSACNFFVYYSRSSRFRSEVKDICRRVRKPVHLAREQNSGRGDLTGKTFTQIPDYLPVYK